ncbi:WYL domain-containing protein [Vagococcus sp. PNs007]|uniref:WYL domain-containing protein n=1 Tax=Vagococcus proximus TaxID=2991417 RepID=A0ABT5X2I1_9ENTE|nr:WYL domain-containing protein [Vagococcus proximus]MDF0480202.1 WYL domain-containing protein [Vagococcus proximus]
MTSQTRILELFLDFLNEKRLSSTEIAELYTISTRTAQRDLALIKEACEESDLKYTLTTDTLGEKYRLERHSEQLNLADATAILKILLAVRALHKTELLRIVDQLSASLNQKDRLLFNNISSSELHGYKQVSHGQQLLEKIDFLLDLIENNLGFTAVYHHEDKKNDRPIIGVPLSLMFDQHYFYIRTYVYEKEIVINYRLDRLIDISPRELETRDKIRATVEDGDLRKRAPFMFSGRDTQVTFKFWGAKEIVKDKFPDATITLNPKDGAYDVKAYVYDTGVTYWLLSQGSQVKVTGPIGFKNKIIDEINKMQQLYHS